MVTFDVSGWPDATAQLQAAGIDVVRLSYSDLLGIERGRDIAGVVARGRRRARRRILPFGVRHLADG